MRKLVITSLLALALVLMLTVGSAHFASRIAHTAGPAHPMLAGGCPGVSIPC
jgi:hypothetical protein